MTDSEEESSDSSDDFLIPADKINLNSSFFDEESASSSNLKTAKNTIESSDSDEDELEDVNIEGIDNGQSAELFSQILKNLEREKNLENLRLEQASSQHDTKDDSKGNKSSNSRGLANDINELLLQGESAVASSSFGKDNNKI